MAENIKWAFICSPFAGDMIHNLAYAKDCCHIARDMGYMPYAPHMYFPQFLDDDKPGERELGLQLGREFMLEKCECLISFEDYDISAGMKGDMEFAEKNGIPIRHVLVSG